MIKYIFRITIVSVSLLMISCGDEEIDITAPGMEVISFTPEPGAGEICGTTDPQVFELTGGDLLSFDVIFSDNEILSQYKIDIHNNFDCHGHGGGSAPAVSVPNVNNQTEDWTVLDIQNLDGSSAAVNRSLQVPENVTSGAYHFQIQVVDVSGNDNSAANIFSLKIKNPLDDIAPELRIDEPLTKSFTVKKGEKIRFVGQVTDNRSLSDGGNGVLYLAYTDLNSGNTFTTDQVFVFDENINTTFDFDFEYTIPQTLVTGNYRFSLGANDGVRNVGDFQFFEVEITN